VNVSCSTVGNQLLIRLNSEMNATVIKELKLNFSDMLSANGDIYLSGHFPEEMDEPHVRHLPRLVVEFNRLDFGRLKEFIDAINCD